MNWFNNKKILVALCVLVTSFQISLAQNITNTTIDQVDLDDISGAVIYPHQSSMTLGKIEGYSATKTVESIEVEKPMCVVGFDNESFEWLAEFKDALEQMEAICFIAQVDSEKDFEQLRATFPKIQFAVTNIDWIPMFMGIKHYPVLITQDQVMQ